MKYFTDHFAFISANGRVKDLWVKIECWIQIEILRIQSLDKRCIFEPIGDVENHEQLLYVLRYHTKAWEEGNDQNPFHEEVGYFIWDKLNRQVLKSFIVPRGIAVNAGGTADENATEFSVFADLGSTTYGICSNKFLDSEFQTVSYQIKFEFIDEDCFTYDENTRIKIKGQDKIFDHIEKNTLKKESVKNTKKLLENGCAHIKRA